MNERNVAELYRLLLNGSHSVAGPGRDPFLGLAESLAARGVLAPSALTVEELDHLHGVIDLGYFTDADMMASVKAEMGRIAKGEGKR